MYLGSSGFRVFDRKSGSFGDQVAEGLILYAAHDRKKLGSGSSA